MKRFSHRAPALIAAALFAATAGTANAAEDYPTVEIGGRAQFDYAFYDDDVRELGDGGEVRRARLFAAGKLAPDWSYKAQFDFADGDADIKDLYVAYEGFTAGEVTIGQFKQFLSLENLTSSKYLTFIERALPTAFANDRRVGVGFQQTGDRHAVGISAYGQDAQEEGVDEGLGAGARFVFTPIRGETEVLHLGVAAAWEQAPDETDTLRFRARPESHVTDVRLVDTGTLTGVDGLVRAGLEAAWVSGPFSLQGEYLTVDVDRDTTDFTGRGWYVFGSWFLTGESRPYKGDGSFGRVKPRGDTGAWELALRYSTLDLDDGGVAGGEEDNVTFGVNYYIAPNLKIQGNYTQVDSQRSGVDDDPDILQFRLAYDF